MVGPRELIARWRCRRLRAALVDHAEGRLAAVHRQRVDAHVRDCARCRSTLVALQEVPSSLSRVAVPVHDAAFWIRQRQQIMRAVRQLPEPHRTTVQVADWWRPAMATGAALLLAVVAAQLLSRARPTSMPTAVDEVLVESDDELAMFEAAGLLLSRAEMSGTEEWVDDASVLPAPEWVAAGVGPVPPRLNDLTDEELDSLKGLIGMEIMPS